MLDLYGPQQCLATGLVPRELVFANPAFLRPCHHMQVPLNRYLHLYAANIGRGVDGAFRVLGDRTQSPSGAGYALENRLVLSRMLPDAFRDCRVQRLAPFFRALRETLCAIAPHNRDNPRIVLLTPGPYNETYFEHAYLARYLGLTLVEGGDLTVRDNRVYLKVLGGLQPVDVILRRLDDDFCDPLELRPDSFLGVPGLVQAVHSGSVAVAMSMTVVYPQECPGGWHILARTPAPLWDMRRSPPALLAAGDRVMFAPVSLREYERLMAEAAAGKLQLSPDTPSTGERPA